MLAFATAACDSASTTPGADATTNDTTEDATVDVQGDPTTTCIAPTTAGDGNHNTGMDCMSCHAGFTAPDVKWTVAGTLYDTVTGTTPVAGATIVVKDANGTELSLVSATKGSLFTTLPVTLPLTVRASSCPDDKTMPTPATNGSCNSCHTAAMRIHLP